MQRINKFLADAGVCSRRQADILIKQNKVKINGKIAGLGDRIDLEDEVTVSGKPVILKNKQSVYLVFHKPVGVICTADKNSPDNIIEFINYPDRIYPIGRLDVASSGLILLTNDGSVVNQILKAENKVEKEYIVEVDKQVTKELVDGLKKGVFIDGRRTLPVRIEKIYLKKFSMIITEGKKRQIRRMCEKFGYNVVGLQRVRIGELTLNKLRVGRYEEISREELFKKVKI